MASKNRIVPADDDGLANEVGPWAKEKHQILCNYVGVTSSVRRKFTGGWSNSGTYIDLYCAMGRSMVRDTGEFIDGSAVAAWKESKSKGSPFTDVFIADIDEESVNQCEKRLVRAGITPKTEVGSADETVHAICDQLNPDGYHFAFIDPYNLASLPFTIIERLCQFKHMDLLIHVSSHDLQRNLGNCLLGKQDRLDTFAPGWRNAVPDLEAQHTQRKLLFDYWKGLISEAGKMPAQGVEHLTSDGNLTLYWLVLASGHPKAEELWDKVRRIDDQYDLFAG